MHMYMYVGSTVMLSNDLVRSLKWIAKFSLCKYSEWSVRLASCAFWLGTLTEEERIRDTDRGGAYPAQPLQIDSGTALQCFAPWASSGEYTMHTVRVQTRTTLVADREPRSVQFHCQFEGKGRILHVATNCTLYNAVPWESALRA